MAKIALICMYDNWALGLRTLGNALTLHGHEVVVVHFKLPSVKKSDVFLRHPLNYENLNSTESRSEVIINSYNIDSNMWTYNELLLLGDVLEEVAPNLIGLSTRSVYDKHIVQIMEQMKRVKSAITVAGGHDASFRPEMYAKYLDFACVGEGEDAMINLASAVEAGAETATISNLVYRKDGNFVYNRLECPQDRQDYFYTECMEKIEHYVIERNTVERADHFLRNVVCPGYSATKDYYTMFGRGCPGRCGFCSTGEFHRLYSRTGVFLKPRRLRPLEKVIRDLQYAKQQGFRKIFFMDSFFLASREELLAFFQAYRKEVALPFFAQLYPEQMLASPDILKEACHAGMVDTVIGIQSGSERVNRQIFNRSLPNSKLVKFADMLASYNDLRVDYHLITHNPFESEEDFQVALDLLKRLPKENANLILQRLRPFVNTNVEQLMREADLSEVNQEILDKRFLLYLLRYTVPDEEFEKLIVDSRSLSFEDLKTAYRDVRSRVKDSMSWTDEGWSRYHSQDYDGAIEAFDHALLMERTHYRALVGRGWSNLQKSRYEPAEESFVKAAQLVALDDQQSRQEIFRGLGWSYYHRNDDSRAIESFGRALDYTLISETNVRGELLRALSWSHQRAGRPEMAKEFLIEEQRFLESPFEGVHPRTCPIFDSTRLTPRNRIMVGRARKALSPLYRLLRSIWFKFVGAKKMTV